MASLAVNGFTAGVLVVAVKQVGETIFCPTLLTGLLLACYWFSLYFLFV